MEHRGFSSVGGARAPRIALAAGGAAVALGAAALFNAWQARRLERANPPTGRFVTADGVRLHGLDEGTGPPVVLIHGNVVTALDFPLSGVAPRAAQRHRVVAFDRPGYGHSERPGGRPWSAHDQAELLRRAWIGIGVDRPIVVGHSWGVLVALALALARPESIAGLVLISGYYYPTRRVDVPVAAVPAIPVVGDLLRHTVSPLAGRALMPLAIKAMFAPRPVPRRFAQGFPYGFATRPSQIRAEAEDAAGMIPAVAAMRDGYPELRMPVAVIAGMEDRVVDFEAHSVRFHEEVPGALLRLVPGAGHMVHHAAPELVVEAIEAVAARMPGRAATRVPAG